MKTKRRSFLILFSLFFSLTAFAEIENYEMHNAIYNKTFEHCKANSWESAFQLGFNKEIFFSSAAGWIKFSANNNIRTLRTSPGFHQALADCYDRTTLSGNLKKQMVDMGHLTTNVSTFTAALYGIYLSGKVLTQAAIQFPLAARTIIAAQTSNELAKACKTISAQFSKRPLTAKEKEELRVIQEEMFAPANKMIDQQKRESILKIHNLKAQIAQSTSDLEKETLTIKLNKIQVALDKLDALDAERI